MNEEYDQKVEKKRKEDFMKGLKIITLAKKNIK